MLNNKEYITHSLQNCLAGGRIIYEHIIFLEITSPDYAPQLQKEKKELEDLIIYTLEIATGKVNQNFLDAQCLVTKNTIELERKTSKIFKGEINKNITLQSLNLKAGDFDVTDSLLLTVKNLNKIYINVYNNAINILEKLKQNIVENKLELYCDIKLIDHYIKETKIFIYYIEMIETHNLVSPTFVYNLQYYFNDISKDHCLFMDENYSLFNEKFLEENQFFLEEFNEMLLGFNNEINPSIININTLKTNLIVERLKYFSEYFVSKLINKTFCEIIIPLYYDHLVREDNMILFMLYYFKD